MAFNTTIPKIQKPSQQNGTDYTVESTIQPVPKTPYQQNLSQPVEDKWYKGSQPTTRETLGQILRITQQDKERGIDLQNKFTTLQADASSMFYAPYTKPTNKAVASLNALGVDTSKIDDEWFENTSYLEQYLVYNGTTNTPSSVKKGTLEQKAAYERYQIGKANELTKQAKSEWEALQEEISYLTNWNDRNYSDDDIVDYIYGKDGSKFAKKYPTLAKMDESLTDPGASLLELNEGIDYSKDAVYGKIWAARNNGGTGNVWQDMAWSALGEGNQYVENPDIAARLDVNNPDTYAPYTVGSTTDDVLMYYNIPSYDRQWLLEHKPDGSDKTETDMWNKAWDAMLFTEKANEELEQFDKRLDNKLANATDHDKVMQRVDEWLDSDFSSLNKLDKSTDKVDSLVDTASAINFSRNEIRRRVEEKCAENASLLNGGDTMSKNQIPSGTDQFAESIKAGDQKVKDAADIITDGTVAEENMLNNTPSSWFQKVYNAFADSNNGYNLLALNEADVTTNYANRTITTISDIMANTKANRQLDALNQTNDEIVKRCDAVRNDFESGEGNFSFMRDLENGSPDQYIPALFELYEAVTGESAFNEDGGIRYGALDEAEVFYDYIVNGNGTYEENNGVPWLLPEYEETRQSLEAEIERTANAENVQRLSDFVLDARIAAYDQVGLDSTGLKTGKAVANVLPFFMDYDATVWNTTDRYNAMITGENSGVDFETIRDLAAEGNAQIQEELENVMWVRDYIEENNIEVSDNIKKNINRYIDALERDQTDYKYFVLQGEADFAEKAKEGREIEAADIKQRLLDHPEEASEYVDAKYGLEGSAFYDLMSDTERDTYYYIYATEGQDAAFQYAYGYLGDNTYGVLHTRNREQLQKQAEEEVKSGIASAAWANTKAIISAPLSGINSLTYTLSSLISGEEFNPNNSSLAMSQYANAVNAETQKAIGEIENPLLKELATGAYEMVYNRGRSFMNSIAFGGVTGKIGSKILQEIVGASNMGFDAMGTAISNAKDKGAEDWQAYAIGGVTLLAETLTEGLTYGNIQDAIHGTGEETIRGVKNLMINWLTSSGVEEMVGESVNDIVENLSDELILGALSEHADLVNKYIEDLGLNPDNPVDVQKAEELARKDELAALAHTAIISYLSPGLDVFTGSISDSVRNFNNIRSITRNMQKNGMNVSMTDVRKQYNAWKNGEQTQEVTANEQEQTAEETPQTATEETTTPENEATKQEAETAVAETKQVQPSEADVAFLNDLGKLDAVQNSDPSTQAGAIGALFGGTTDTSQDIARAAATGITNIFGTMQQSVTEITNLIVGAKYANIDVEQIKSAIQTAVLSISSEANRIINSEEFQNADYTVRASMLASTTEVDASNEAVQAEIDKSTYENRVAEAEGDLIRNGALDTIKALKAKAEQAIENVRLANESLAEKRAELQAKSDALNVATEEFNNDPSADNQHSLDRAVNELQKADIVAQEYEQHLANIERASEDAQDSWKSAYESTMRDVRQQAEAVVEDQNRQRAERDAKIAEQQRIAEEQAVQAQIEEDTRSGKKAEADTLAFAQNWADTLNIDDENRDAFIRRVMDRQEQQTLGKIDMSAAVTNAEGYLAIMALSRKTGLKFELSDALPDGVRGAYRNGVVLLNNNLVKNGSLTVGQALVEGALHELPHSMEQTNSYQAYRQAVLDYLFGAGDNFNQEAFDSAVRDKILEYNRINQSLAQEEAVQEIVADFARTHLADKEVVQRFMDAGLGGRIRNALHNINQAIKNFVGRLRGEDLTTAEYLRKAEYAFENALNELSKTENKTDETPTNEQPKYSFEGVITDADIDQQLARLGLIPTAEEVQTPTGPQRQFGSKTAQNFGDLSQGVKDYLLQNSSYVPDTNEAQIQRATDWVMSHSQEDIDPTGLWGALDDIRKKSFNPLSVDGQVRLFTTMALARNIDNVAVQTELAQMFNKSGTPLAQAMQARKLFRMMTPAGRISILQREVDNLNQQLKDKGKWTPETNIELDDWIKRAAATAVTEEDFKLAQAAARKNINEQIPVNWKERLNSLRMISMLSAPPTHMRNVIGNLALVPIVATKNKAGAVGELVAQVTGMIEQADRTKTLKPIAPKEIRNYCRNLAKIYHDTLTGEGKYQEGDKRQRERKVFGTKDDVISKTIGKAIQWYGDVAVGKALELEDWVFLKGHFRRALSGLMVARGLTPSDMNGKVLENAVKYAIEEAQRATYRDASPVADALGNLTKLYHGDNPNLANGLKVMQFIVNARFPFKKTPINIGKRAVEYSAIGFAKSLTYDMKHLQQYLDCKKSGNLENLPKTAITPTQFIDKLSSGLTGIGVMLLGVIAGRLGFARCAFDPDDPEDMIAKLKGEQEYSIRPGAIANNIVSAIGNIFDKDFKCELFDEDISTDMDWMAPASLMFFTGVSLENQIDDVDDDGNFFAKLVKSTTEIMEPMLDMSMMQSVNEMFKTNQYSSTDPIWQFAAGTAISWVTSLFPTLGQKINKTLDPTDRSIYIESGDKFPELTRAIGQIKNKIPVLPALLGVENVPYVDAFGESPEHVLPAVVENLVSPASVTRVKNDDAVLNELERLIITTKNNPNVDRGKLVPTSPDKTIKIGNETIKLNGEQMTQMKVEQGKTSDELLSDLFSRQEYLDASDETKANMVTLVYAYSKKVAQYHIDDRVKLNSTTYPWIEDAYKKGNAVDTIVKETVKANRNAFIKNNSKLVAQYLEVGNTEDLNTCMAWLKEVGATDSEIRKPISDYYRPLYKEAYANDDDDTVSEIEDKLESLDIGFTYKQYFKKWRKDVDDGKAEDEEEDELDTSWLSMN